MQKNSRTRLACSMILMLVIVTLAAACIPDASQPVTGSGETATLTILYTNDEHGWLAGNDDYGGAPTLMAAWRNEEGYTEEGDFLILSGGDTWTGPAISTWFDGEPMVEVMNEMGYTAAAIGNHEFDNNREVLAQREAQAEFTFVSANIRDSASGEHADFATPYVVQDVNGLKVGIIGLTTRSTPRTTMPSHVQGLDFTAYKDELEAVVPQVKADGAQVLVVIAHISEADMAALAPAAADLGIAMIGGGHRHERVSRELDGVALVQAGSNLRAYGRVDITYDNASFAIIQVQVVVKDNDGTAADAKVAAVVERWEGELDDALGYVIGYTETGIPRNSQALSNLIVDAWLTAYPADIAFNNPGGVRQDIPAGEITLGTIVGVMPFDNVLVDAEITGKQVMDSYRSGGARPPGVAGMTGYGGFKLSDGTPIDPDAMYHVLVNNFMAEGGDGYRFGEWDPDAYPTGIDWREPVIDWIIDQKTSPDKPLESLLDGGRR